jgi:hypothetical protein
MAAEEKRKWKLTVGAALIAFSVFVYALSILVFHDSRTTFFYIFQDLAFLPLSVFFVTLILDELMVRREKEMIIKKLNMVVGVFFSETGNALLALLATFDTSASAYASAFIVKPQWAAAEYAHARKLLECLPMKLDIRKGDRTALKEFLTERRSFLLSLLENPNMLEHDRFTDLLWAVFHTMEELSYRTDLDALQESDLDHLSIDINRTYRELISEWLIYLRHLQSDYPYLFSLAVRLNPFNRDATAEIRA